MLVRSACPARRTDCARPQARRYPRSIRALHCAKPGRGNAELDQRLLRRDDLRYRRNGAHAGPRIDHAGNPAAVGHDLSSVRLRAPPRITSQARAGGRQRKQWIGESGSARAFESERRSKGPHSFKTQDGSGKRSVQILVAVEGCGIVETPGTNAVTLARGDAVVVPASVAEFQVRPQWTVEFLKASVP